MCVCVCVVGHLKDGTQQSNWIYRRPVYQAYPLVEHAKAGHDVVEASLHQECLSVCSHAPTRVAASLAATHRRRIGSDAATQRRSQSSHAATRRRSHAAMHEAIDAVAQAHTATQPEQPRPHAATWPRSQSSQSSHAAAQPCCRTRSHTASHPATPPPTTHAATHHPLTRVQPPTPSGTANGRACTAPSGWPAEAPVGRRLVAAGAVHLQRTPQGDSTGVGSSLVTCPE